jgi:hypothetical protein
VYIRPIHLKDFSEEFPIPWKYLYSKKDKEETENDFFKLGPFLGYIDSFFLARNLFPVDSAIGRYCDRL